MEDNNSLGSTIRLLRKERHLTQEELAEGICSPVTVSRIADQIGRASCRERV
mgnify:CR=1 FL=1